MTEQRQLVWEATSDGIAFKVIDANGVGVPTAEWGRHSIVTQQKTPGNVAPLLALIEDELVQSDAEGRVIVPHAVLADLDSIQARQLGLPDLAPVRLKIQGQGILTSPSFRFQYRLVKGDGSAIMGIQRTGALLTVAGKPYLLLNPMFGLLEGMEAFNETPPEQMDDRMLRWAEMKPLLPDDALVDDNLRSMNIVRADAFTLDINDAGEFSPQLLHKPYKRNDEEALEDDPHGEAVLPAAPQRDFEQRFRTQPTAKRHYTTQGNWFVVVPENLQKALQVVREYQEATYAERRAFIANPAAILKERLQDQLADEELDRFFEETPDFLSARVSHLGVWEPKANVYMLPSGQNWLPNDERGYGVVVSGGMYNVAPGDAEVILERIRQAQSDKTPSIEYNGQAIPANDEAAEAFARLVKGGGKALKEAGGQEAAEGERPEVLVPVLIDNVEEVGYVMKQRAIRGEPGGLPAALKTTTLYPHQKEGLAWLQEHWANGSTGALLADDMGLGKTLQTLAFLVWVQEQMEAGNHPRKPMMIVAPTGLLKNWEDEAGIHLSAVGLGKLFRAFGKDLHQLHDLSHSQRKAELESADWVLTTYETLRDKILYFTSIDWAVVAFDEVQKIKNPASRLTEMAKSVEADFCLALTGTPVENRLGDLWSIIDTIAPGQLGSLKDFHQRYETEAEDAGVAAFNELRTLLTEDPKPARLLRRMKSDHLKGLPDKNEQVVRRAMPAAQAAAYDAVIEPARQGELAKGQMLEILQGMRKISLMPEEVGVAGITDEVVASSARLTALIEILDQVHAKNEKALVFLEFIAIQDALIPYLQQRYQLAEPPLRISGSVQGHVRKKHVDEFQRRPRDQFDVMLLSPKAGGVGLTLTAANHVIHLSRWWNPAVEDQCTDRAFRIGQNRNVDVYYPLAIHPQHGDKSFDLNLHALLERKRELSKELLAPPVADAGELDDLLRQSS